MGLLANGVPIDADDLAPLGQCLISEHDTADDLVVMLNRVGEAQRELLKALRGGHAFRPPAPSP